MIPAILEATLRGVLSRRRSVVIVLFAVIPILIAAIVRMSGTTADALSLTSGLLDALVVRTVLPLVALVFGTAVLGSELEDGTAVYLLVKPIPRWRIVGAKYSAAASLTVVLVVIVTLASGLLVGAGRGAEDLAVGETVAVAVGALVYVAIFLALSIVTSRALIIGLGYTLIWEGLLAGLFEGTRVLSVHEYTNAIARLLAGGQGDAIDTTLAPSTALALAVVVTALALAIAVRALAAHEARSGD